MTDKKKKKKKKAEYWPGTGRRKRAIARVRISEGSGQISVNGKDFEEIFPSSFAKKIATLPLNLTGKIKDFDISIICSGGGKKAQPEAIKMGLARALVKFDPTLRITLRKAGYLTRDSREKERKKPGLKRARRAPQWQKR